MLPVDARADAIAASSALVGGRTAARRFMRMLTGGLDGHGSVADTRRRLSSLPSADGLWLDRRVQAIQVLGRLIWESIREPIPVAVRRDVVLRDGETCQLCDNEIEPGQESHLHHLHPAAYRGRSTRENLVRAHGICKDKEAAKALARRNYPV